MSLISLYIDENLTPKIAAQLRSRGIDALSVRDLGLLGDKDANHLRRATVMGRVLVTTDKDFLRLSAENPDHAGIIFGIQEDHSIGDWVTGLELICIVYTAEEITGRVEYL
jgi:hypothetical protein